jgi:Big-like domain-containing protein
VTLTSPNGGQALNPGENADLTWTAGDNVGVTSVDLLLSRGGASGAYEPLASGIANSGSFTWLVTGPATTEAFVRVVAHDALGNQAADTSDAAFTILGVPTGVGDQLPREFSLDAVAPNPTAGEVQFVFATPRAATIRLTVHDVQGREVARLVDGDRPAGRQAVGWDGRVGGGPARAGLYFVRLVTPDRSFVRRLIVVR